MPRDASCGVIHATIRHVCDVDEMRYKHQPAPKPSSKHP